MSREPNSRPGLANDRELLPVRCGYADTQVGQLHYRSCGAGPDVVLLHWAPASGRMYEHVLPLLARAGFRGLAFDLPGYGRSHKKARGWTPERVAREVLEAAQSLNTGPMTVVGGHASSSVAIEMLLAEPNRVLAGVLDGVLALTPEETKTLMSGFTGLSPRLREDGEAEQAFGPFEHRLHQRGRHQAWRAAAEEHAANGAGQNPACLPRQIGQ